MKKVFVLLLAALSLLSCTNKAVEDAQRAGVIYINALDGYTQASTSGEMQELRAKAEAKASVLREEAQMKYGTSPKDMQTYENSYSEYVNGSAVTVAFDKKLKELEEKEAAEAAQVAAAKAAAKAQSQLKSTPKGKCWRIRDLSGMTNIRNRPNGAVCMRLKAYTRYCIYVDAESKGWLRVSSVYNETEMYRVKLHSSSTGTYWIAKSTLY